MSLADALPSFAIKSIFKDALPTIEKFAPTLGGVIGGVPGLAISFAVPLLAKAFNADPRNFGDIVNNIMTDQAAPLKLQALEDEHADWLASLMHSVNKLQSAEISIKLDWNKY